MALTGPLVFASLLAASDASNGIQKELARLGVDTALVLPSSALDDFPIWSPDSRYVGANVMGAWNKVDLRGITLVPGTWHGSERIGVIEKKATITLLSPSLVDRWKPQTEPDPTVAENGWIRIEFRQEELRSSLVLTRRGKAPVVKWTTDLEECGAPVLSPDGYLVAFLCLTNGLFVMDLR